MISIFEITVLSLASARVAYAVTQDEIFRPLRERIYRHSAPHSDTDQEDRPWRLIFPYKTNAHERANGMSDWEYEFDPASAPREPGFLGQLVECPYCFTFWTSALAFAMWALIGTVAVWIAIPLAIWCIANVVAVKGLG